MRNVEEINKEIEETKNELKNVHGEECEVYARIVGYYRNVKNWNKGKRDEFDKRKMFNEPDCESCESPSNAEIVKEADKLLEGDIVSYELYIKDNCPNCPPVHNWVDDNIHINGVVNNCSTENGLNEAKIKGIIACPTVIFYNVNNKEIARCHNVDELTELFKNYKPMGECNGTI